MNREIKLFIDGQEVEFKEVPAILYNWQETDYSNPTVTMNSYSANITVEGTPQNDRIFGSYWNLERYVTPGGSGFNPTYRIPFTLYVDNDIFESGYVKLQKVTVKGAVTTYEISLFGGLGQFLYNLSTDWNTGEKKSLADMRYFGNWAEEGHPEIDEVDLGFTINKETVKEAWDNIQHAPGAGYDKWTHINFAPCYNGLNDKMTNDKAVVNMRGIDSDLFPNRRVIGAETYHTYQYTIANLPRELTEWETKDLRSWAQRPVISSKSIINAICTKVNNKGRYDNGYDVQLDSEFFSNDNPYYFESWMTLPMLTSLEFNTESGNTVTSDTAWSSSYKVGDDDYTFVITLPSAITEFGTTMKMKFNLMVDVPGATASTLYPCFNIGYSGGMGRVANALGIQAYASNNAAAGSDVLASSEVAWLYHKQQVANPQQVVVQSPTYQASVKNKTYSAPGEVSKVVEYSGQYDKISNGIYRWSTPIEFSLNLPAGATCVKVNLQFAGTYNSKASSGAQQRALAAAYLVGGSQQNWWYADFNRSLSDRVFANREWSIDYSAQNNFYSNRVITKEQLLATDYSPADWLMSFCKMFGLYIWKEPDADVIHIDSRRTFYRRDNIKNIEDLIDYSKDLVVSPVAVESGYYTMKNETEESGAFKDYMSNFGKEYGMKIIDTGYEFDANTTDLIESPLKGAVQVRDNSGYYFNWTNTHVQPYCYDGLSYIMYDRNPSGGIANLRSYENNIAPYAINSVCTPLDAAYPYFDLFDKPQFCDNDKSPVAGENVMLFFNYFNYDISGKGYMLTDDLDAMATFNSGPCYLMTAQETDSAGTQIAIFLDQIPQFSRYFAAGNSGLVQFSFDWGPVRQMYVPQLYQREENNLYGYFYQSYLEDLYDINTKVLTCYVKPNRMLKPDDLRNFYWFQNALWRLNKVEGYNVTSDETVKCEFVKVQDVENMTNIETTTNAKFIYCTITPDTFPASGGTAILEIKTNDGFGACAEEETPGISVDWGGCGRDGKYNVTVEPNTSAEPRTLSIQLVADNDGWTIDVQQEGTNSSFQVWPTTLAEFSSGETAQRAFAVTTTVPWSITSKPDWIWVSPASGSGVDTTVHVSATTNTGSARQGVITVSGLSMGSSGVTVSQASGQTLSPGVLTLRVEQGYFNAPTDGIYNFYVYIADDAQGTEAQEIARMEGIYCLHGSPIMWLDQDVEVVLNSSFYGQNKYVYYEIANDTTPPQTRIYYGVAGSFLPVPTPRTGEELEIVAYLPNYI